jgi:diguanylate cyclase (GGDEF)-like protein
VLFDLEDRKRLKVQYGRQADERALLEVASVLRAALRPGDVCARYEDSEFVLVASGCGWEEVEQRRREIQRAVASLEFDARPGERVALTLSAGAALFPRDGSTWEEVMTSADRRLQWDRASRIPV